MALPKSSEIRKLGQPGTGPIEEALDRFHQSENRRKFAYCCMVFDACVGWLLANPAGGPHHAAIFGCSQAALAFLQSNDARKWSRALDQIVHAGEAKPLDADYATELMCFGSVHDGEYPHYRVYNHSVNHLGGPLQQARAGVPGGATRNADLNAGTIAAAQRFFPGAANGPLAGIPSGAFELSRSISLGNPGTLEATAIYMRKRMRGHFQIFFKNGLAYRSVAPNVPFTTQRTEPDQNQPGSFVMQRMRFIYAMSAKKKSSYAKHTMFAGPSTLRGRPTDANRPPDPFAIGMGALDIQHSSFLKGQPVLCAGNVEFSDGVLIHIDNGSGHYKPRPSDLLRAVKALVDEHRIRLDLAPARPPYRVVVFGWLPNNAVPIFTIPDLIRANALAAARPRDAVPIQVIFSDTNIRNIDSSTPADMAWWMQYRMGNTLDNRWT